MPAPLENIRILDMSRTTLNVAGDLVAASVIDALAPPDAEAAQPVADAPAEKA